MEGVQRNKRRVTINLPPKEPDGSESASVRQEMELSDFQKKVAAYQAVIQMQAKMLEALHRQCFEQQQALQEAEAAWDEASCEHDREVATLRGVFENLRRASPTSERTLSPLLLQAEESTPVRDFNKEWTSGQAEQATPSTVQQMAGLTRVEDLEAALSDAKIEALEAEQERARWEARAQRTMDEASEILQEERSTSASRAEDLERLLTYAEARIQELETECKQQAGRADRAEAAAARLEDEMAAAQALWAGLRQRERDWEETAGFLQGQLAVAQSQAKIARLRLVQQSGNSLGSDPYTMPQDPIPQHTETPTITEPVSDATSTKSDCKENRKPPTGDSSESIVASKFVAGVRGKRSVRVLPSKPFADGKTVSASRGSCRVPLMDVANSCITKEHR